MESFYYKKFSLQKFPEKFFMKNSFDCDGRMLLIFERDRADEDNARKSGREMHRLDTCLSSAVFEHVLKNIKLSNDM